MTTPSQPPRRIPRQRQRTSATPDCSVTTNERYRCVDLPAEQVPLGSSGTGWPRGSAASTPPRDVMRRMLAVFGDVRILGKVVVAG
jgi:hypothetical protein